MPAVFSRSDSGDWIPSAQAQGPFTGLQGGAVAGLMVAEIEALAAAEGLGTVVGVHVNFFRATPRQPLRTTLTRLRAGRRAGFIDSVVCRADGEPCATARATLIQHAPLQLPAATERGPRVDPAALPERPPPRAPHGGAWFMDTMQSRLGADGTAWFKVDQPVVANAGPLARALGPADWCHGIHRPQKLGGLVAADPNQDLSVRLARAPRGDWLGLRPTTLWQDTGLGVGFGTLCDVYGDVGQVAMSVALVPGAAEAA